VSQFISELIKKYYNENGSDHSTTTPTTPEEVERLRGELEAKEQSIKD
jgi:hypothetical protein